MIEINTDELFEKRRTRGAKDKKKRKKSLKDVIGDAFPEKKKEERTKFPWESTLNDQPVLGTRQVR